MPKPSINATMEALQRQMARGGQSGSSPASSGNVMPGPSAISSPPARAPGGGATAGLGANPASSGASPPISGVSSRDHALTLASTTHLARMGHPHPRHAQIRAAAQAGIKAAKMSKGATAAPRKFGSLGGAPMGGAGGMGGSGMSPMNSGMDDDGY